MNKLTVWHDGNCQPCRAEIALMRRLDTRGAIGFVDATTLDRPRLQRAVRWLMPT